MFKSFKKSLHNSRATTVVEIMVAVGIAAILLPALLTGFVSSRGGRAQQNQRLQAVALMNETKEALRTIRENNWQTFAVNGTYYPAVSGNTWTLVSTTSGQTVNNLTRLVTIADTQRATASGAIVSSGGYVDKSTKTVTITITWTQPYTSSLTSTMYMTRYLNNTTYVQTTVADFNAGTQLNTAVITPTPPIGNGELGIIPNTKGKWCAPSFSSTTIQLPDGPPVAVAAKSYSDTNIPNDVFVATAPYATSSVKLAYVRVPANVDPPAPSLHGIFTMDSAAYSDSAFYPTTGLTNSFRTNSVKYYTSPGGSLYALLATDMPDKEMIAVLIKNSGGNDVWQDTCHKTSGGATDCSYGIYKYWTFFNTRAYQGDSRNTPNQDQAPYGYGATTLTVLNNTAYLTSGGYLYAVDLSTIDSKTTSTGLDMVGCRIELDGYDCNPAPPGGTGGANGSDSKYKNSSPSPQTGTTYSDTATPAHSTCSDGGNTELYANDHSSAVQVGGNTYVYIAVGAGTNPELDIVNATSIPTGASTPPISSYKCGTIANGNASWKRVGSLDFNTNSNTEEAANSVYIKDDGTRAYMTSNGATFATAGVPDSYLFYVINTSNPAAPAFLTTTGGKAGSGYYYPTPTITKNGNNYLDKELFPRRSLTVLNGQRAILVGKDGITNANNAEEYQVLDLTNESAPAYCGGIDFNQGFNDLTYVIEADSDTFVYMVANDNTNQLRIIQGGPDGTYLAGGSYYSATFSATTVSSFNRVTTTASAPANTNFQYQVAVSNPGSGNCANATWTYIGPDGTSNSYYYATSSGAIPVTTYNTYSNPGLCFRYKVDMSTTDYNATPLLYDLTVNYTP
jgi:type II secretory pathway pseudopilin PulG